ncbi:hypothetical protein HGRIS_013279 [Hohenbuehelia grisea]|uniref:NYN domain-containing protein n=1 Tax=Hohenbuehelia grisea TaxID=104357 RepID=A0ABR3IV09_9AGAR
MQTCMDDVAIFWDYENCHAPSSFSGYDIIKSIRDVAHGFGTVKLFKAYLELSEQVMSPRLLCLRSELQSSGVSLTDCPHNGRKNVADQMIIVDMLTYAIDNPAPATVILISGDRDFAYAASVLRLRRYRVVVIALSNPGPHISLKAQASLCLDWNVDIISKIGANSSPSVATKPDTDGFRPLSSPRQASLVDAFLAPSPSARFRRPSISAQSTYATRHYRSESNPSISRTMPTPHPPFLVQTVQTPVTDGSVMDPSNHQSSPIPLPPSMPAVIAEVEPGDSEDATLPRDTSPVAITEIPNSSSPDADNVLSCSDVAPTELPVPSTESTPSQSELSSGGASPIGGNLEPPPATGNEERGLAASSPTSQTPPYVYDGHLDSLLPQSSSGANSAGSGSSLGCNSHSDTSLENDYAHNAARIPGSTPKRTWADLAQKQFLDNSKSAPSASTPASPLVVVPPSESSGQPLDTYLTPIFAPLVQILERYLELGIRYPPHFEVTSKILSLDQCDAILGQANVATVREYFDLAESHKLVQQGRGEDLWIMLGNDHYATEHMVATNGAAVRDDVEAPAYASGPSSSPWSHSATNPEAARTSYSNAGPIPTHFRLLIQVLERYRQQGQNRPLRMHVAVELAALDSMVYQRAGAKKFSDYSALAVASNLVILGGLHAGAWISLHPSFNAFPPHFLPLVRVLRELHARGVSAPLRSLVGAELLSADRDIYRRNEASNFAQYTAEAVEHNVVVLGGVHATAWISLNPSLLE